MNPSCICIFSLCNSYLYCATLLTTLLTYAADAELWTTGSNDSCQLGHKGHETQLYPSRVQALDAHGVCQVACGQQHMLAVADRGALCAWGAADLGQLGMHTHTHAYIAKLVLHPASLESPFSACLQGFIILILQQTRWFQQHHTLASTWPCLLHLTSCSCWTKPWSCFAVMAHTSGCWENNLSAIRNWEHKNPHESKFSGGHLSMYLSGFVTQYQTVQCTVHLSDAGHGIKL